MNLFILDNVEFRYSTANSLHGLVQWEGNTCFVIAFFRLKKEGFGMETVGERFFNAPKSTIVLAKHALRFLNGTAESINNGECREPK